MSPYRRFLIWFGLAALLLIVGFWLAEFYTEYLWYHYDAYAIVFQRRVVSKLVLFGLTALLVWAIVGLNFRWVMGHRIALRSADSGGVDPELRAWLETLAQPLVAWLPRVLAVVGGLAVAESWQLWLLAFFGVPFGATDPQFGADLGFFVYRLGAWQQVVSSLSTLLLITAIAVALLYFYLERIRLVHNELIFDRPARNHILGLVAAMLVLRALGQWLSRYSLAIAPKRFFTGVDWTAAHVTIPGLVISAAIALLAAGLCLWVMRPGRSARPAYYGVGLHVLAALLATAVAPSLVHRLKVAPNELQLETPYIERAIKATRAAFGIHEVSERNFPATSRLTAADLARNRATVEDIRIWDHRPLLRTFAQLQEIRQYYDIIDVDSDRYLLDGRLQQVLVSARELNHTQLDAKARSWINQHLEYTHGFGLVISSASSNGEEGQPKFLARDIPPRTVAGLEIEQARIYFGEMILMPPEQEQQQSSLIPQQQAQQREIRPTEIASRQKERLNSRREPDEFDYLLVGTREEFDYAETTGDQELKHQTVYQGAAGIPVGGFFRRIALSLRLHSLDLAVSALIKPETKLLLHRQVTRRVTHAAPFLQWDVDPYPIVADGRIYWICEAYTYSKAYPYSEMHYASQMTPRGPQWTATGNYIRNPIKAVVDAYEGTVDLYLVDPKDPLAQSYDRIYPGMFKPLSAVPRSIREHFRYPVHLFTTQTDMYRRYHMTDPRTFYNQEDLWAVAREVDREAQRAASARQMDPKKEELYREMEPYYITMTLPGEQTGQFMLISAFTPFSAGDARNRTKTTQRDNLIAWMGALCDPERYGELVVYNFPKDTNIYGPLQIEARIDQDDAISQQITLWDRGGSQVIRGNLLIIPIESSLLYVEPLYLESEQRGLPELKRIIVAYEDQVVMEPTLAAALERLFGRLDVAPGRTPEVIPPRPANESTAATPGTQAPGIDPKLLVEAQAAFDAAEEALRRGDWSTYDLERERLRSALEKLAAGR